VLIITVVSGPDKGRVFRLADDVSHRIGRRRGSIALDDRSISSKHAELTNTMGEWTVTDLGSSNGTYVNKQKVEPDDSRTVVDGDRIQFGRSMVVFNLVPEADPSATGMRDTPIQHASLAIEERNQQLLEQIVQQLAGKSESDDPLAGPPGGFTSDTPAYDDSALRDMLQQVLDRLDKQPTDQVEQATPAIDPVVTDRLDQILSNLQSHQDTSATDAVTEKLDAVRQQLDQLAEREPATESSDQPAVDADLHRKLDDALATLRQRGEDDLATKLDAVIELVSSQSTHAIEHKLDALAESITQHQSETESTSPDLSPIQQQLDALRGALNDRPDQDWTEKFDVLHQAVASIDVPDVSDQLESLRQTVESLRDSGDADAPAQQPDPQLTEKLDEILRTLQDDGSTRAVETKIDKLLAATAVDGRAYIAPKLETILEAVTTRTDDDTLAEKLDAILEAAQGDDTADLAARLDALTEQMPRYDDSALREKLDQLLEKADTPTGDSEHDEAIRQQLESIYEAVQRDNTEALTAKLDELAEKLPRYDDTAVREKLDAIEQLAQRQPDTAQTEKLDAILEALRQRDEQAPDADRDQKLIAQLDEFLQASRADHTNQLIARLEGVLENHHAPHLQATQNKLDTLHEAISKIADQPGQAHVDLSPIEQGLEKIHEKLDREPTVDANGSVVDPDLERRLDVLIDAAHAANESTTDLADKLDTVIIALADQNDDGLEARLTRALETIVESTDLSDTNQAVDALRQRVDKLLEQQAEPSGESSHDDLRPMLQQVIDKLDAAPAPADPIDPAPHFEKLHETLGELRDHLSQVQSQPLQVAAEPDPRLDQIIETLTELSERQPAAAQVELPELPDYQPMLQQVLDAVQQQREQTPAEAEPDPRLDTLTERLEAIDARLSESATFEQPEVPDHRPMLRRILEAVENNHGQPDGVPTDEKQLEKLLRKIHDRLNALSPPPNSERIVGDMFALLRSLEQEQQRQADAIQQLAERARESARAGRHERDHLLHDDEPLPRPSHRMSPASSAVVPHQPSSHTPSGSRSVLMTVVIYVGFTLAIFWTAMSIAGGKPFNPFAATPNTTPDTSMQIAPADEPQDIL